MRFAQVETPSAHGAAQVAAVEVLAVVGICHTEIMPAKRLHSSSPSFRDHGDTASLWRILPGRLSRHVEIEFVPV